MNFSDADTPLNNRSRITRPPGGESSDIFGTAAAASPTPTPPVTPRKVKNYMASTIFSPQDQGQVKTRQRPDDDSFKRLFGAKDAAKAAAAGGDATDGGSGSPSPRGKNYQKSSIIFQDDSKKVVNGVNGNNTPVSTPTTPTSVTNGHEATNGHAAANGHGTANGHGIANGHGTANGHGPTNGHAASVATTNGHATSNGEPKVNGQVNGHATNGVNGIANGHQNGGTASLSSSGSNTPNGSINGDYKPNGQVNGNGAPGTPSRRIPPGGYSSRLW